MKKARIMIVEDERVVALDLKKRLIDFGYSDLAFASSGREAIEKAGQFHPDMVLMDIVLEGEMDGIEAASHIHQQLKIPIVFLTAHGDDTTVLRATRTLPTSFIRFVIKPFETNMLKSAVEQALQPRNVQGDSS